MRLKNANPDVDTNSLIQQVFRISNVLYGNKKLSAYELAKGRSFPVNASVKLIEIPPDIEEAYKCLQAKRKLSLILNSNSVKDDAVHVGDLVDVFRKHGYPKREKWSDALPILSIDKNSNSVCLPGKNRRTICAAAEDIRPHISNYPLSSAVRESIDILEHELQNDIDNIMKSSGNDHIGPRREFELYGLSDDSVNQTNMPDVGD